MSWSALAFRGRIVCYDLVGDHIEARELGSHALFEVTPELRAAIDADRQRSADKAKQP